MIISVVKWNRTHQPSNTNVSKKIEDGKSIPLAEHVCNFSCPHSFAVPPWGESLGWSPVISCHHITSKMFQFNFADIAATSLIMILTSWRVWSVTHCKKGRQRGISSLQPELISSVPFSYVSRVYPPDPLLSASTVTFGFCKLPASLYPCLRSETPGYQEGERHWLSPSRKAIRWILFIILQCFLGNDKIDLGPRIHWDLRQGVPRVWSVRRRICTKLL